MIPKQDDTSSPKKERTARLPQALLALKEGTGKRRDKRVPEATQSYLLKERTAGAAGTNVSKLLIAFCTRSFWPGSLKRLKPEPTGLTTHAILYS